MIESAPVAIAAGACRKSDVSASPILAVSETAFPYAFDAPGHVRDCQRWRALSVNAKYSSKSDWVNMEAFHGEMVCTPA